MKLPKRLEGMVRDGLIDDVIKPLTSGKEADVFVVYSQGEYRCAKVYKDITKRNFKKQAGYQEGRKVQNSRKARAMEKRTKFGRKEIEAAWQNAEVDALFKVSDAGVNVPEPYICMDGVLLMELIVGDDGDVAPRLLDVELTQDEAMDYFSKLIVDVLVMLCAGIVHGDLSEYNVLVDENGPVIIDFPQAVDAASNNNAGAYLIRDLDNLRDFFSQYAPCLKKTEYGREMWSIYKAGNLTHDTILTGTFKRSKKDINVNAVLEAINEAREEAEYMKARAAARAS
ncbi:MAG: serine protein kinase RIO [Fibrobacterales bacterium]